MLLVLIAHQDIVRRFALRITLQPGVRQALQPRKWARHIATFRVIRLAIVLVMLKEKLIREPAALVVIARTTVMDTGPARAVQSVN